MPRLTNSHSITRPFDASSRGRGFANFLPGASRGSLLHSRTVSDLPPEISPLEVKALLDQGVPVRMIDVREPAEHAICHIEGARLIPMRSIPEHLNELDESEETPIVVFCHHGVRSLSVVNWLRNQGVSNSQSMAGGIDLWSVQVDPKVPRY